MPIATTSKKKLFEIIEHRFLVVGHTHLPSDRDFAIIEKYKRHYLEQVYSPDEWYQAVLKAKRKIISRLLSITASNYKEKSN